MWIIVSFVLRAKHNELCYWTRVACVMFGITSSHFVQRMSNKHEPIGRWSSLKYIILFFFKYKRLYKKIMSILHNIDGESAKKTVHN